jgi:hypothetical protein
MGDGLARKCEKTGVGRWFSPEDRKSERRKVRKSQGSEVGRRDSPEDRIDQSPESGDGIVRKSESPKESGDRSQ